MNSCVSGVAINQSELTTFAIEESIKKRDPAKAALSSMIKTIGGVFDLQLSIFARDDEMDGEKTVSITCFKVEKAVEMSEDALAKRARIGQ